MKALDKTAPLASDIVNFTEDTSQSVGSEEGRECMVLKVLVVVSRARPPRQAGEGLVTFLY